ncbi:MAG: hypothetical protein DWB56_09760 [Candidatus Jettenia sp.]|nr:MAG: hypothetical protein EDM77_03120 [Candidatus Jettenia sp. AMX1]MBC6929232.1 hypothetical protein [Candidatus Jettenia sp.]MCE7880201.1 hypothetical protein [Candidatus Jettenia sp. AMX1]MCQ3926375.1 hypothetical protein [Candidatus Jettenia sp.]
MFLSALLITAFVSFVTSAVTYFFAKIKIFSCALLLFYGTNFFLSFFLLNTHITLFIIIIILFLAFPIICLLIFVVDTYRALFCTDTSFVLVIVWLLMPPFFMINLIVYTFRIIHAGNV